MDSNHSPQRTFVTSYGVCSPVGFNQELLSKVLDEDISLKPLSIDNSILEQEIKKLNLEKVNPRRMDRLSKIAIFSAASCFNMANVKVDETNQNDIGGVFCTTFGPIQSSRDFVTSGFKNGIAAASPLLFPFTVGNAASGLITIHLGIKGFNTTISGYSPICYAFDTIQSHKAKAIIAGGFEELTAEMIQAFKTREVVKDGKRIRSEIESLSEGSAMVFIESEDFARSNNSNILFEICGYGLHCNVQNEEFSIDCFGEISPETIFDSMKMALDRAGLTKDNISAIVSLSRSDSSQTESELVALNGIWENSLPPIYYVKKVVSETFGANDSIALIYGYKKALSLKAESNESIYVLINSYHIGGNCFSTIIRV